MMNLFENDDNFLELTQEIWDFLCPSEDLTSLKIDAIFVFGGIGNEIPVHASNLYNQGVSDTILVTGNSGKFTKDVFKEPEALVFKKIMIENNVPEKNIIVELDATNAGENVTFGYDELRRHIKKINNLVLVCRSFMARRSIATFKKQHPQINCFPSPPKVNLIDIVNKSRITSAKRLIAELDRLIDYYDKGFIAKVEIPENVINAKNELIQIIKGVEKS